MRDFFIALGTMMIVLGLVKLVIALVQYRKGRR